MKFNRKHYSYALIVLSAIILFYFLFEKSSVAVSEINWKCEWKKDKCFCDVTFMLKNDSSSILDCDVSIRGQKRVGSQRSVSLKMVGEKYTKAELPPNESVRVNEIVEVSRKPDLFQINTW